MTTELKEMAAMLVGYTPENTDEMADICAEVHKAMDLQDKLIAEQKGACADLQAQLDAKREPFRAQLAVAAELIAAGKAALTRRVEADEAAALADIAMKAEVPAPRPLPKGLRITRASTLAAVDLALLPEGYLTAVADADRILQAAEAGLEVPGATVEIKHGVIYTRGKKAK